MPEHTRDENCTVDSATSCCTVCGVYHGDPCPDCGGRAFHRHGCPRYRGQHEIWVDDYSVLIWVPQGANLRTVIKETFATALAPYGLAVVDAQGGSS